MKYKDLEAKLYQFTRTKLFKDKSRTLEEALEEALDLKPEREEQEENVNEEEWL